MPLFQRNSLINQRRLPNVLRSGLKQDEAHQVYYIVPDHIKFTAEMEMIRKVGELLTDSPSRSYASTRLQVYSFKRLLWYLLRNEAITEKHRFQSRNYNAFEINSRGTFRGSLFSLKRSSS